MSQKTKEEMYGAVQQTMAEINEILAKSGYAMDKAEPEPAPEPAPEMGAPEPAPEMPEEPAPEPAPEEGGEPGAGDEMEEMRQHAQELSDEELQMMLEILTAEQETRSAAAPEEGGEPAPEMGAPEDEYAEKSMKEDYSKMMKSIQTIAGAVDKLNKSVEEVKKQRTTSAKRPAVTNRSQVLSKSDEPPASEKKPERLSKSDTMEYVYGQIGKQSAANTDVMADLNLARTDEELHEIQDGLVKKGFEFPKIS